MRVGLITTWTPERCGVATYSEELVQHVNALVPDIEFKIIDRPFTHQSVIDRCRDVDVVHLSHVWSLFGDITQYTIKQLQAMGKKTVCTFQESTSFNRGPFTEAFDRVVVHQKTSDGFIYIPHGIPDPKFPEPEYIDSTFIGTAGFPIGFKNNDLIARIANHFGMKVHAFAPESPHADARAMFTQMNAICPGSLIDTAYNTHAMIIEELSKCLFTTFLHNQAGGGVSGSVRLGIAAKRPVVITTATRFHDLYEGYKDEFYVVPSAAPTFQDVAPVVENLLNDLKLKVEKKPNVVLKDMNWTSCAEKYIEVYRSLYE